MGGPELVVGLVTPIGTNTADLTGVICGALSDYNYLPVVMKLSDLLPQPVVSLGEAKIPGFAV